MDPTSYRPPKNSGNPLAMLLGLCGGVASFGVSFVIGFITIRAEVRSLFPERHVSEAYEGFGDAQLVLCWFLLGMTFWLLVSIGIGVGVGALFVRWIRK
jgi:hypothetical protein